MSWLFLVFCLGCVIVWITSGQRLPAVIGLPEISFRSEVIPKMIVHHDVPDIHASRAGPSESIVVGNSFGDPGYWRAKNPWLDDGRPQTICHR